MIYKLCFIEKTLFNYQLNHDVKL